MPTDSTSPPPNLPAADWYADPHDGSLARYWDGAKWTQNVAPISAPEQADSEVTTTGTGVNRVHPVNAVMGAIFVGVLLVIGAAWLGSQPVQSPPSEPVQSPPSEPVQSPPSEPAPSSNYDLALDNLVARCPNSRSELADAIAFAQTDLQKYGIFESLETTAMALDTAVPASDRRRRRLHSSPRLVPRYAREGLGSPPLDCRLVELPARGLRGRGLSACRFCAQEPIRGARARPRNAGEHRVLPEGRRPLVRAVLGACVAIV